MEKMKPLLSHYDSSIVVTPIVNKLSHNLQEKWTYTAVKYSIGVTPIVNKLSHNLQEKWTYTAVKYMNDHDVAYPPFRKIWYS
jgi:hypothetical protein